MKITNPPKILRFWYILLLPLLVVVFYFIAIAIINPVEYPNSDFFTFWLSGRLFTTGENPYDSQVWVAGHHQFGASWIPNATFIYPMPVSLLFAPLGLLPLYQAYVVWVVLSQLMILFALVLLLRAYPGQSHKSFILPIFAGIILFRPLYPTLLNGQVSGLLLLVVAAIIYAWEKGKWKQGAVFMAILALKPNIGIPIIGLLALYLMIRKQASSLLTLMISGAFLIVVGWIQNPDWIIEFWNAGNTKLSQNFGFSPTVWGISALFCDYTRNCTIGSGIFASLLFMAGYIYILVKKRDALPPSLVVGLAVVITVLLTPYVWVYDQLLLAAPIVTLIFLMAKKGHGYLPVSSLFIGIDMFAFFLLGIAVRIQLDIWNVCIPLFLFCLIVWVLFKKTPSLKKTYL